MQKEIIRILIVDDDEDDRLIIKDFIHEGMVRFPFVLEEAASFQEALTCLHSTNFDVCLFDYRLGENDGIHLIRTIRGEGITPPVIFLTGQGDEEVAVLAMKSGAADYLPKTKLTPDLLCHSIIYTVELHRTDELRKQVEMALRESESRYRTLVTHIPAAICELAPDGTTVFTNPAVTRITGYLAEELEGRNWWYTFLPKNENHPLHEQCRQFQLGDVANCEIALTAKDGSVKILDWNSTCRYGEDGSLQNVIGIGIDITELIQLREKLKQLSIVDELTGVNNRRGFLTLARQQMNVANRSKKELGLVFIDMDGMKQINDTLGHLEGDAALRETADILREAFRESDVIARMGGDEFAVLITEIAGIKDDLISHRLQEHVDAHNAREGRRYRISLSTGIVRYDPQNPCPLAELIAKADLLMYSHKQSKKITALKSPGGHSNASN